MRYFLPFVFFYWFTLSSTFPQQHYYSIPNEHVLLIEKALDNIYNRKFKEAELLIDTLERTLGNYAGLYLLKAYYFNLENGPLSEHKDGYTQFINAADCTLIISQRILEQSPDSFEARFFLLSVHAMLARAYVDTGHNWKAILEAKKAYNTIINVMDNVDDFPEFNLYCGIYNYYREKYPEDNTYVRPILWFFKHGDKHLGLSMLKSGSEKGLFTKMECLTYLYYIHMRYEFQPQIAIEYSRRLIELYPDNKLFKALYVENLIYTQEYCESEPLIADILLSENPYHKYIGTVYQALYYELYEKHFLKAERIYNDALLLGEQNNVATPHFQSMCYLGLGRIYLADGDIAQGKTFLKLAEKTSEYGFIRDEAKRILQTL